MEHSLWRMERRTQHLPALPNPRMSSHFTSSLSLKQPRWQSRYSEQLSDNRVKSYGRMPPSTVDQKSTALPDLDNSQARASSFSGSILPQPTSFKGSFSETSAKALVYDDASNYDGHLLENNRSDEIVVGPKTETMFKGDGDCMDDKDLFDGESEPSQRLRLASQRVTARQKIKRFRLTHQQSRFLMSEFVKQPHPDAAHRDRLSRQVPGLSPRQVQVWFQNRRSKIKRLNVEDRDKVIRMRAALEELDTVQALQSPYGAFHGHDHSLSASPDLGQPEHNRSSLVSPLIVDVRRSNMKAKTSPGLTPPYNSMGFGPGARNSDVVSNLSSSSSERPSYYITSAMGANSGMSIPFQEICALPCPHFRDSLDRSRADSAHSSTHDFRLAQNTSPSVANRQPPMYPVPSSGYEGDCYSTGALNSSPGMGTRSNSTTSFSAGLDSSNEYRPGGPSSAKTSGLPDCAGSAQYTNPSMYPASCHPSQIPGSNGLIARSSRDRSPYQSLPAVQALAAAKLPEHCKDWRIQASIGWLL
ncbi:unnamed protein product [Clonostachys chloroleuca]|uniref:Homeobox domain-containing protein n=1 Tax=Clonostachys chloroleuca TaxID=1926264 RepID=A0AA35M2C2_9HYPO|nr:unnamed protein product [Clonostachys chloroleuca]